MAIAPMPARERATPEAEETGATWRVGDARTFAIANPVTGERQPVHAVLQSLGSHLAMWVESGVALDSAALSSSVQAFERRILPALETMYGGSVLPEGLIYHAINMQTVAASGYYIAQLAPEDAECWPLFVMNVSALEPGTREYESVLTHEMQHVWQSHVDSGEDAWITEGASQLAEMLAGYPAPLGAVQEFEQRAGTQLDTWSTANGESAAHYGASFLFMRYLYEQYGEAGLRTVLVSPEPGLRALGALLALPGASSFTELFGDWSVANLLDAPGLFDGRDGYSGVDVDVRVQNTVDTYPQTLELSAEPYAAQYIELLPDRSREPTSLTITLQGAAETEIVPASAPGDSEMWWSNRGDGGHSWLQRTLDLRDMSAPALTLSLWYDIEPGWDYAAARVSVDGGVSWTWLDGECTVASTGGTDVPPQVYTGLSGAGAGAAWVRERLDLAAWAGQVIVLRLDMFTDDAVSRPGLCVTDTALEAGGGASVALADASWEPQGFARIENRLPLTFVVRAVTWSGGVPTVGELDAAGGAGNWALPEPGREIERAVLIVSALTPADGPLSTEPISYTLSFEPQP